MRIQIKGDGQNMTFIFPTALVFSKAAVWLANHVGRKYAGTTMDSIPPEAMDALFSEFRRIKKKYGRWELVDIESSGENVVKVIL